MSTVPFLDLAELHKPIRNQLDSDYKRVMDSGWFIMGPELEAFEQEFAAYCSVKYCIGVGNGLEAIHLLLRAYGIGAGDEVIVPSNTFIATWLAVSQCGAIPVPVEPDVYTHNLDPALIEQKITKKTKAIIPVHLYGQPAAMYEINAIASKYDLVVIEDAAQAQGALYKNCKVGSLGHSAATSFYPGKNLGGFGDGGAVLTSDAVLADKVRRLRNYGSSVKYQHELAGYNSRLDELQAAFLRTKLKVLDDWNAKRNSIAQIYTSELSNKLFSTPEVPDWATPVWHLYVIKTPHRNEFKRYLEGKGVATVVHYPIPPHKQACYLEFSNQTLPISELLADQVLSLPMSPCMTQEQILTVITVANEFSL